MIQALGSCSGCGGGERLEFGANAVGVGVVEFVEDFDCLAPGRSGGFEVGLSVMVVAETGERVGFEVAFAYFSK